MILDLQKAQQHLLNFRSLHSKHTISFKNLIWGRLWKIECSKRRETAAWCGSEATEHTLQSICFKWFSFAALLVIFRYSVEFETEDSANLRRYMHLLECRSTNLWYSPASTPMSIQWGFSFSARDGKEHTNNNFEGLEGQSLLNRQVNTSLERRFNGNISFLIYTHNWDFKILFTPLIRGIEVQK